jgi:hypothetical protein
MNSQLTITLSPGRESSINDVWLHLEQESVPVRQNTVSAGDIAQMVMRARTGMSAYSLLPDRCPAARIGADGKVTVTMHVLVWPCAQDMAYELTAAGTVIGPRQEWRQIREFDLGVAGETTLTLPWMMEHPTASWSLGCYDRFSQRIDPPEVTIAGATVTLSRSCYGVLRVRGLATGYRYPITVAFTKAERNEQTGIYTWNQVGNVKYSALAVWVDAEHQGRSAILPLTLPSCAGELLQLCPHGDLRAGYTVTRKPPTLYYNACTGQMLRVVRTNDDHDA